MKGYMAIGWTTAVLILFGVSNVGAHSGPFDGRNFKGRIAFNSDGNCNDEDDWGAFPVAVALLDAFGMKNKLVHVDYCNIMPENDPRFYREMVDSVLGSAKRYNIPRSILFDCQKNLNGAVESIKNAINVSSAKNPLYYVLAGSTMYSLITKHKPPMPRTRIRSSARLTIRRLCPARLSPSARIPAT